MNGTQSWAARALLLALFSTGVFFTCTLTACAQTQTTVTGTVTDPNGVPYAGGTIDATLVPTGVTPTVAGIGQIPGYRVPVPLDKNGAFTMPLYCNTAAGGCTAIQPSGTQWMFTVRNPGAQPPVGYGAVSFTATITITGATQSITSQLHAAAPLLLVQTGSAGSVSGTGTANNVTCWASTSVVQNCPDITDAPGVVNFGSGAVVTFNGLQTGLGDQSTWILTYTAGATITAGQLVKFNGTGETVIPTVTTDTTGIIGVALNGATATNPVQINRAWNGIALLDNSGSCTDLEPIINSTTTAGEGHCVASPPVGVQVVGGYLNTGAGDDNIDVYPYIVPVATATPATVTAEQLLSINVTPVTVNTSTSSFQTLQVAASALAAGSLNTIGKTVRIRGGGTFTPSTGSETVDVLIFFAPPAGGSATGALLSTPIASIAGAWDFDGICTTTTTGASGVMTCEGKVSFNQVSSSQVAIAAAFSNTISVNLTGALTPQMEVAFSTPSASNTMTETLLLFEGLN
jgi:hypothetical protein